MFFKRTLFLWALICWALMASGCASTLSGTNRKAAGFQNALRPTILNPSQPSPKWSIADRMDYHRVPGVAVAIIRDRKVILAKGFGSLSAGSSELVNQNTVFSVGSVSKVATAAITLKLSEQGILDLDQDVDIYLRSWQIPDSDLRADAPITLRMIMSHTAGFSVHGFADYFPGEPVPTILDVLNGAAPAKNDPVELIFVPGTARQYSGGGVTVEQMILTDILSKPFDQIAKSILLKPLAMEHSSFENPLSPSHRNIARAHDMNGMPVALPIGIPTMPEQAASGLWTSANDLGRFVVSLLASYANDSGFLMQSTAQDMMSEVPHSYNGLGPRIDRSHPQTSFNHPGANDNYRAWIEGNLETGDALVVLTNGTNGFSLITEIRNGVADYYGWDNNPAVTLEGIALSTQAVEQLLGQFVLDDSYPTLLQEQLTALRKDISAKGVIEDGALKIVGVDLTVILPLFDPEAAEH